MNHRNMDSASESCEHMIAVISTLVSEEQDTALAQKIVEHLAECESCSRSEASLVQLLSQYRTHQALSLPSGLEQRLLDQVCRGFENGG